MKKFLLFIFILLSITPSSQAQFLLIKGVTAPSFPAGTGPWGTISGVAPSNGDVVVLSGKSLFLTPGVTYDFKSLTVNAGGTIRITGHGIVVIGSVGDIIINGTIVNNYTSDYTFCSKTLSVIDPASKVLHSHSYTYASGPLANGAGGNGGSASSPTASLVTGGSGAYGSNTCGLGSGGGGGAAVDTSNVCGGPCAVTTEGFPGTSAVDAQLTQANKSNFTLANGEVGILSAGGRGGGAAGGNGASKASGSRIGGGGGGGGFRGGAGSALIIRTRASISGTGTINLSGQFGFNGGAGANGVTDDINWGAGGGGGGGGGSGGPGGAVWIYYKTGSPYNTALINVSGGAAGSGGAGGAAATGTRDSAGTAGTNGNPGPAGTITQSAW